MRGQTNIALQQVRPWTCYFPWGRKQQLGMNSIITHTRRKALLQVHMGKQADREVDKHKQEHLSCQTSPRANTDTGYQQGLNLEQIRQGDELKRGQSLVFVLSVQSSSLPPSLRRLYTDDKGFVAGKQIKQRVKLALWATYERRLSKCCVYVN